MKILRKIIRIIKYIENRIILQIKGVTYDSKSLNINGLITIIDSGKNIKIGKNVTINSGKLTNPIGGDIKTTLIGKIEIGNNVGISNATIVAYKGVKIGDNVLIGGSTKIYDTDFHSLQFKYRMEKPDLHIKTAKVEIGDGSFIGAHCIILKGVTIGKRCIIGAGSVVTKNIPDGEIWAGNPARFIRKVED